MHRIICLAHTYGVYVRTRCVRTPICLLPRGFVQPILLVRSFVHPISMIRRTGIILSQERRVNIWDPPKNASKVPAQDSSKKDLYRIRNYFITRMQQTEPRTRNETNPKLLQLATKEFIKNANWCIILCMLSHRLSVSQSLDRVPLALSVSRNCFTAAVYTSN